MWFFLFVLSVAVNCSFTIYFACYCVMIEGFTMLYVLGLIEAVVFCGLGWILTCTSVSASLPKILFVLTPFTLADPARLHEPHHKRDVQLQALSLLAGQTRTIPESLLAWSHPEFARILRLPAGSGR